MYEALLHPQARGRRRGGEHGEDTLGPIELPPELGARGRRRARRTRGRAGHAGAAVGAGDRRRVHRGRHRPVTRPGPGGRARRRCRGGQDASGGRARAPRPSPRRGGAGRPLARGEPAALPAVPRGAAPLRRARSAGRAAAHRAGVRRRAGAPGPRAASTRARADQPRSPSTPRPSATVSSRRPSGCSARSLATPRSCSSSTTCTGQIAPTLLLLRHLARAPIRAGCSSWSPTGRSRRRRAGWARCSPTCAASSWSPS